MTTSSRSRALSVAGFALAVILAGTAATHFAADSGAIEKKRPAGRPAVPVSVAVAAERDMPLILRAIGNVDAFSTVAIKARVDGQIVEVNFQQGQAAGFHGAEPFCGDLLADPAQLGSRKRRRGGLHRRTGRPERRMMPPRAFAGGVR